jgi:hypothetical protein
MTILQRLDVKLAAKLLIILMSVVVIFHLFVLAGVIPYQMVWGGRLQSAPQMHLLETISLAVNLAIIIVIAMKGGFIKPALPKKVITFVLWLLVALFTLNTIGNLFSETTLEMILFTPITLASAVLCYRLAIAA